MSGTVLGKDQVDKINALYAKLVAHIKGLLTKNASAYEKMVVYTAIEYLNTTELAEIFSKLPFISPAEKRALVRAAIDDVRHGVKVAPVSIAETDNAGVVKVEGPVAAAAFTPPAFKINAATTTSHKVV